MKTTAKTKLGNFQVRLEVDFSIIEAYITIKGIEMQAIVKGDLDRIFCTPEMSKVLGINHTDRNALMCDLSEARKVVVANLKNYTGESIDSKCGFFMKDTKANWDLVRILGYDAIDKVA